MTEMLRSTDATILATTPRSFFFGNIAKVMLRPGIIVSRINPTVKFSASKTSIAINYYFKNKFIKLEQFNNILGGVVKLVVLIPAYNEEENIGSVISGIPRKIDGVDEVQVLVVSDGSTDNTVSAAKNAGAERVISLSRNSGVGFAFRTGIKAALEMGADIVVNIDGDGQFNSADVGKIIKPILEDKADMVSCSRFLDKSVISKWPWVKRFGNSLFTRVVNFLTKKSFTDTQCGFRAYTRECLNNIVLFGDFTYTQEVFLEVSKKNFRIKEIPLMVKYDKKRKSRVAGNVLKYGIMVSVNLLRTLRDYGPLTFFGAAGLGFFLAGFLLGLYIVFYGLFTGVGFANFKVTVLAGVLLITGFQLFILALIADMLGRQRQLLERVYNKQQSG